MADSPSMRRSPQARTSRTLQSMAPGTMGGRVASASPTAEKKRQVHVDETPAVGSNVLLLMTGSAVPPDTPYGTIIVEDSTGLYTGIPGE